MDCRLKLLLAIAEIVFPAAHKAFPGNCFCRVGGSCSACAWKRSRQRCRVVVAWWGRYLPGERYACRCGARSSSLSAASEGSHRGKMLQSMLKFIDFLLPVTLVAGNRDGLQQHHALRLEQFTAFPEVGIKVTVTDRFDNCRWNYRLACLPLSWVVVEQQHNPVSSSPASRTRSVSSYCCLEMVVVTRQPSCFAASGQVRRAVAGFHDVI